MLVHRKLSSETWQEERSFCFDMSMATDVTTMQTPASSMPGQKGREHVVIFPFPSRGHIIPLLHLSTALSGRGLKVTFITTPGNLSFFHGYLRLPKPNIDIKLIPFPPSPSVPSGVECTNDLPSFNMDLFNSFVLATFHLDQPFRRAMKEFVLENGSPICVISDFFCWWTLEICQELGIPRLVFHGMGVFSLAVCKALIKHGMVHAFVPNESDFHVEGTPERLRLRYSDVPLTIRESTHDGIGEYLVEIARSEENSWGVLVNSFDEMELEYVPYLESFFKGKAWLAGPLSFYPTNLAIDDTGGTVEEEKRCLEWLNGKEEGSVLYVSFGSMVYWPEEQLDEIWHGLEASGYQYVWVVRSDTWTPQEKPSKGLIHKSWAPQKEILGHPSLGGFLSHCGWNSVLEGISTAVPILAWPVIAEQVLNAKFLVDELEVAVGLKVEEGKLVGREVVREGVREVMGGVGSRKIREKLAKMRRTAKAAVGEGGSSYRTLDKLIEELRGLKK